MQNTISKICEGFEPISLEMADNIKLFNRTDTKFVLKISLLPEILLAIDSKYFILEIESKRLLDYHTLYYDTEEKKMYRLHHNGKLNRFKIRQREYLVSGTAFLEIKFKNNKGRTLKKRILREAFNPELNEQDNEFIVKNTPYSVNTLRQSVTNYFSRITLVHKFEKERITIDFDLGYKTLEQELNLSGLTIVEVKRERHSMKSEFIKLLKSKKIYPTGISKYCIGTALTDDSVKKNIFKKKILTIKNLIK